MRKRTNEGMPLAAHLFIIACLAVLVLLCVGNVVYGATSWADGIEQTDFSISVASGIDEDDTNSWNEAASLTNALEYMTWNIQAPTNGIPYWFRNPWPRDVTVVEVFAQSRSGTNQIDFLQKAFATGWDAATVTIESDVPVDADGTTDSAISGTAAVSNGHYIGFQSDVIGSLISVSNVILVGVGVKP